MLLFSVTATEAMQWIMDTETGTYIAKITDTHAPGKIDTQNFNICSMDFVKYRKL